MSWNWLFAAALSPIVCVGQGFSNLRATHEGTLFFLTQTQPMGAGLDTAARVWVKDVAGIRQFPGSEGVSGFEVSADGGVVVLYRGGESIVCNAGGTEYMRLGGTARSSGNGRFLAVDDGSSVSLLDVLSKEVLRRAEGMRLSGRGSISENGAVPMVGPAGNLYLMSRDGVSAITLPAIASNMPLAQVQLYLDEAGRSLAAIYSGQLFLKVLSAPSSSIPPIFVGGSARILRFDGLSLDYLQSNGILHLRLDGRPAEVVVAEPGLGEAAAVRTGHYFYTRSMQLIERGLQGVVTEVARIESIPNALGETMPGSLVEMRVPYRDGWSSMPAQAPYPSQLGGYRVLLNGRPAPIVGLGFTNQSFPILSAGTIRFLVPWSLPLTGVITQAEVTLETPSGVIFQATPLRLYVRREWPRFERGVGFSSVTMGIMAKALHADGSVVTASSPAAEDELVTVWMRGLGMLVSPPPDDRLPDRRISIAGKLDCLISDGLESRALVVDSATLSLREAGVYEVDFRVPRMRSRGELHLGCELNGVGGSTALPVRRAQ